MVLVNSPFHDPTSAPSGPAGGPPYSHHHQPGAALSMIPLLTAGPHHQLVPEHSHSQGPERRGGESSGSTVGGTTTCQDCGNQAKKDCLHRRCRTCCKSRGFDCATHVKSTWVPAARRRERHMAAAVTGEGAAGVGGGKKPRLAASSQGTSHTSTSANTPPRSFDTGSSHQDVNYSTGSGSLPSRVRAPAVFKCVRVSSIEDDGEDEYAYQAVVKIGGRIFKGVLYDHGAATAASSSSRENLPNLSDLHLGGSSTPVMDAAALLEGTSYGNPPIN
ncbi:hypothetical protein AMTRI_Chr01g105120 [Amborella trichopoda]